MKNFSLLPVFCSVLLVQLSSCSQENEIDCRVALKQQPYLFREYQQVNMNPDSVNYDYSILQECGNLDSVDGAIFEAPLIAQLVISDLNKTNTDPEITYQYLIDLFSEFKKDRPADYQKMRTAAIARLEIQDIPVKLNEFERIRPNLIKTGMTEKDVAAFKAFLEKSKRKWTYMEAVKAFFDAQTQAVNPGKSLEFPELKTLNEALKEAKTADKNCLIYFTGWACVNARKFENQLLKDSEIQRMIQQNFIYKAAFVDDRSTFPDGSEIGKTHMNLQVEKFKSSRQPDLYILSPDGKILANWSYEDGTDTFKNFLEKGIGE